MDKATAALLLENMLERLDRDPSSGKWRLGIIGSFEKRALELACRELGGDAANETAAIVAAPLLVPPPEPPIQDPDRAELGERELLLDLTSLDQEEVAHDGTTLCLDFGTAMSKAFATDERDRPVELGLGSRAMPGGSGYAVESALFITDDGLILFGPFAVHSGAQAAEAGRMLFDSPKARLSMGVQGEISKIKVAEDVNPTTTPFTEEELITLYLSYLTDLACSELEDRGHSRYTRRRFARPCWSEERNRWAGPLLRRMLAKAQILADTFHEQWQHGIPVQSAKAALDKVSALSTLPEHLISEDVPEPVAAAASLMLRDEAQREMFLVIDVGAGTTDFGLFVLQHNPRKEVSLVRIVPGTIDYLPQAGNRVDDLLKAFVLEAEGIDPGTAEGRHNLAYLQGSIRLYKEALLRDGTVEIPLANQSRVSVARDAFLLSERVKAFRRQLEKKLVDVLAAAGDGYVDLMYRSDLKVVLTGGGAELPMVVELAEGVVEVRGRKILRTRAPAVPAWIDEEYPQFTPQYGQLAVAIGGASSELPSMGETFEDFKGMSKRTYA